MNGTRTRIAHEETSYWSVCLGLVAVILVGTAVYYFSSARAANKKLAPYDYNKPVPSDSELSARLKEDQYKSTRQNWTEPAFQNEYWNNDKPGLYVDVITGDPLFSSQDKFDFQNGRVNFSKPLAKERLVEKPEVYKDVQRTEVRTVRSNSHLGLLFHDGPPPSGDRYVINSASLKFIPADKLEIEGYSELALLFPKQVGGEQKTQTK
jgi:peptide-methionine (R)-S-oxide reductase